MSFTFTKEGLEMRKLLNNENWEILHRIFHNFCYYRGISIKDTKYIDLIKAIAEETSQAKFRNNACIGCAFLNDKILQKISEVENENN